MIQKVALEQLSKQLRLSPELTNKSRNSSLLAPSHRDPAERSPPPPFPPMPSQLVDGPQWQADKKHRACAILVLAPTPTSDRLGRWHKACRTRPRSAASCAWAVLHPSGSTICWHRRFAEGHGHTDQSPSRASDSGRAETIQCVLARKDSVSPAQQNRTLQMGAHRRKLRLNSRQLSRTGGLTLFDSHARRGAGRIDRLSTNASGEFVGQHLPSKLRPGTWSSADMKCS